MATARNLLDRVAQQLEDPRGANWSPNELLQYLNEALQQLVMHVPQDFTIVKDVELRRGPKQDLPPQGVELVDIIANVNQDGSFGRAPFTTTLRALGYGDPDWQGADPAPTRDWAYDPANPDTYWVSPPAPANHKLRIEYVERPSTLTITGQIPVREKYHAALVDYVLYRALSKDADYAGQSGLANLHYQSFLKAVGASSDG